MCRFFSDGWMNQKKNPRYMLKSSIYTNTHTHTRCNVFVVISNPSAHPRILHWYALSVNNKNKNKRIKTQQQKTHWQSMLFCAWINVCISFHLTNCMIHYQPHHVVHFTPSLYLYRSLTVSASLPIFPTSYVCCLQIHIRITSATCLLLAHFIVFP